MKITEISRTLVYQCEADKIESKAYWDSHGKQIPWEGSVKIKYDEKKKIELYRVEQLWESEYLKSMTACHLEFFVDGERLTEIGEITLFKELKTKIKLECCVGAG